MISSRFFAQNLMTAASVIALCGSTIMVSACSSAANETKVSQVVIEGDLKPDSNLLSGTLENGVRYAILRNATPPGTGALRVQFQTGSLNELPGTGGLAHYLEHMAFNGSKNVPEGEMIQILERLGLSFGADTNATTSLDKTVYKLNLPTLTPEVLDAAFMLMGETAYNLTLDQDAIERELGIILSEKRTRDSANYRSWENSIKFLTEGSDLMDRLPIGTDESLNSISSEDFRAYYDAHYHPEKTIVAFVGDEDPEIILEYIKKTFADWKPETEKGEDRPPLPAENLNSKIGYYFEEGLGTRVSLYALRPYTKREDSPQKRFDRLIDIIGPRLIGYRMQEITEKADRPFINASMSTVSLFELTEGMVFNAYTQPENWERALKGLDLELRKALEYGFTQAELDAHLARIESGYIARAEGADTRATTSRFGGLIDSLMTSFDNETVFTHPKQDLERFLAYKDKITLEAVNAAFRKNWGDVEDLSLYLVSDAEVENPEQTLRQSLNAAQSRPLPEDDRKTMATEFAYQDFGEAGEIISEDYLQYVDAHLVKFANNVRLNFKQTDFDEDRVLVSIDFGEGIMSTPRKDEGLRRMMFGVLGGSGYEAHTVSETQRLMAGKLVSIPRVRATEGSDSFKMSAITVPNDFRDQLNLFAAFFTSPAFREDARENHIDKLKAWYPRHDTTMDGVRSKYLGRFIRGGDERWGFESEEEFYSPKMSELESWLRPQMEKGLIEITVIGDIDKETVIREVSETLGAIGKRRDSRVDYPEMRNVSFPQATSTPYNIFHKGDESQAQLRLYWPAGDGMNPTYARRLSVLRAILRNRLVTEIREGEATTYSPGAGSLASQVFPDYGYVLAVLTLKPEDMNAMSDKVTEIVMDMASGTITEDEFTRAIKPMLERLESVDKNNTYWLSVLSDAQTGETGLRRHATREGDLRNMSLAEVQRLASEVFQLSKTVEVHILPENDPEG